MRRWRMLLVPAMFLTMLVATALPAQALYPYGSVSGNCGEGTAATWSGAAFTPVKAHEHDLLTNVSIVNGCATTYTVVEVTTAAGMTNIAVSPGAVRTLQRLGLQRVGLYRVHLLSFGYGLLVGRPTPCDYDLVISYLVAAHGNIRVNPCG